MPFPHEAILGLDFFSALVDAFLQITRGLRPLVILGNASTCAEKKSNPRIASWGKDTFPPWGCPLITSSLQRGEGVAK